MLNHSWLTRSMIASKFFLMIQFPNEMHVNTNNKTESDMLKINQKFLTGLILRSHPLIKIL